MARLEMLYLKLPTGLQHVACSLEGWRIRQSRLGNAFARVLREAQERAFWSETEVIEYRDRRLRAFIQHAARTVPFYRDWFRENGIAPETIREFADLEALPILTKAKVQDHTEQFFSEAVPTRARILAHTSGTTGAGLRFPVTLGATHEQWAIWWRYRLWHGIEAGTWCGYFGGRSVVPLAQTRSPFWRYNYPGRQILFSGYHMSPANLREYVSELRSRRPPWLHGYPSLLSLLAAYLLDQGEDLGYPVRWITIGAENLLPQQAELIERAFSVRPRQHYGMAEAVANISECEQGRLHVDEDFAAVEFVRNPDGPGWRIIGTNFTNPATPLIRYDVQDVAALSDEICPCGRPGRIVSQIDGRHEDYVVLRNGARIGRLDHIFKDMVSIREAQIHQREPGEITVRVVRGASYRPEDEKALLQAIRERVGSETTVQVQYTDTLERSRAGKLRFVVSDIPQGRLGQPGSRTSDPLRTVEE